MVVPRSASPSVLDDAGPLRLLRRWRQQSAPALVRQPGGARLAQVVVSPRSSRRGHMDPPQRTAGPAPTAFSQDPPWLRRRERISLVKNRMRESCTSGSVRGGDGNVPTYSAALLADRGEVTKASPPASYRASSLLRNTPRNSLPRTRTGSRNAGREPSQRWPSRAMPPPGTTMCTWG